MGLTYRTTSTLEKSMGTWLFIKPPHPSTSFERTFHAQPKTTLKTSHHFILKRNIFGVKSANLSAHHNLKSDVSCNVAKTTLERKRQRTRAVAALVDKLTVIWQTWQFVLVLTRVVQDPCSFLFCQEKQQISSASVNKLTTVMVKVCSWWDPQPYLPSILFVFVDKNIRRKWGY